MNNDLSIQDFIYSPDTVDFIVRQEEYLADYINKNPNVLLTQVLSGGYVIGYANVNVFNDILTRYGQSIFISLSIVLVHWTVHRLMPRELCKCMNCLFII